MRESLCAYKDRIDHILANEGESELLYLEIYEAELVISNTIKQVCTKRNVKLDFQMSSGERLALDYMVSFLENNFEMSLITEIAAELKGTENLRASEIFNLFVRSSMNDHPKRKEGANSRSQSYLSKLSAFVYDIN